MKKVVLVDGNNLIFRSYYATAYSGNMMKNSKGFPTNAVYGFLSMINKIIAEEKPEYMAVAFDIGKNFRFEKYHDYKAGRIATPEELKAAGLGANYAVWGHGLQATDPNGVPWTAAYINVFGDSVTNLHEDMAAEQKALATYYQLINLTDDIDIINVLRFLGEREIVHYQRFGEALMDVYDFNNSQKIF